MTEQTLPHDPPLPDEPTAGAYARAIVETVRTPLLVLDEDLVVVTANRAFVEMYGPAAADVVGHGLFGLSQGHWDDSGLRDLLERVLPEQEEVRDFHVRGRIGGLGVRDLVLNARQVRPEGTDRRLILVSMQDITERERYRRELEGRTRRLERSNRDLQDFAHAASHDLQEPLRKIHVYVDHLTSVLDAEALDERSRRYLLRLPGAVERMQTRIDDLLQLARVGRSRPVRARIALDDVVVAVLDDLEVQVRETGAHIEVGKLPTLEADGAQMRVLFQNLVSNALKFHKVGVAPVVRIHETPHAESASDGQVRHDIVVADEGIGFEPEYAERIFGAFQRLHGQSEYEGNGVGLALCRRIADRHGGSITATSRPKEGARFTVTLPESPPPEEEEG